MAFMKDICRNPDHSAVSEGYYTLMVWSKVIDFWNHLTGCLFLAENKFDIGRAKPSLSTLNYSNINKTLTEWRKDAGWGR